MNTVSILFLDAIVDVISVTSFVNLISSVFFLDTELHICLLDVVILHFEPLFKPHIPKIVTWVNVLQSAMWVYTCGEFYAVA